MQRDAGGLCNRFKPMLDQFGIPLTQFFLAEAGFEHTIGAARNIKRHSRQSFIHRRERLPITANTRLIAHRLRQSLTQRQRAIFGRVMLVHVQIAVDFHRHINQRMAAELFHHMIQETDTGGHIIGAVSVEINLDQNFRFGGVSFYSGSAHKCGYTQAFRRCKVLPLDPAHLARHQTYIMTEETADSLIPYDDIVQEALRAVVGRVLNEIVAGGSELPGNHHFYITFKTGAEGVSIPDNLRERFPDEMTIVLQNKFWDLGVDEEGFTVGLTFNAIPAKLDIPFAAITAFVDPAVDFGLQFQATVADMAPEPHDDAENDSSEQRAREAVIESEDGSNVVSVDFGRKK